MCHRCLRSHDGHVADVSVMRVLFLDDDQRRHDSFVGLAVQVWPGAELVRVYTAAAAIAAIDAGTRPFTIALLDHDLSREDLLVAPGAPSVVPTGYAVVEHLVAVPVARRPAEVIVHSCNTLGATAMTDRLLEAARLDGWAMQCRRIPFPLLERALLGGSPVES